MNFFTEYPLFSTAAEALGITILHSLWQGFLLLFLLALFLRLGKSASPNIRFAVAYASLLIFLAAFVITLYQQWSTLTPPSVATLPTEIPAEVATVDRSEFIDPTPEPITVNDNQNEQVVWMDRLTQLAPWLAWFWVVGSAIFALRLINGFTQTHRLRRYTQPISIDWQQRAKKLAKQLGISQAVSFAVTDRSSVPLTLGWIKPIILIPISLLATMPADQLEAIFIHELAHIKRRDYLWNLIQSVAEVVLFYHPAYWYISSVLERERELACDHLTVAVTRRPRIYAQALLQIAAHANLVPLQSVAATGKRGLSNRIQQIIYPGRVQRSISILPFVLLLSLISLSLAAFSWYQPDSELSIKEITDPLYDPVFSTQDGYGTIDPEFLKPLNQPDADSIDYGPTFQEVMNSLSDEFLDTTSLRVDEMYDQVITIDQSLNQLSRSAARLQGDSLAESPVNYSASSVVYLLDDKVVDPKQVKSFSVKSLSVFRQPFHPDLQNLVDREYSIVVQAISRKNPSWNTEGSLRPPDYIDYGHFASLTIPISRHLSFMSDDGYLIGQNDFGQTTINPRQFFQKSTLYLLDGNIVDEPNSIKLNTVRRFEVYYDPLPISLRNLADKNYSAVVRAFSWEYKPADNQKPFSVSGQITTREEGKIRPVSGVKVEVKENGEQAITDAVGKFRMPATAEGTLIVHWPDKTLSELEIDGREFFHLIAHTPKRRLEKYRDELQKRLAERMSVAALERDKKAIQREVNALDKAINSLQEYEQDTLTRVIRGRVMDAYANQGIEGTIIKASDGSTAITDAKGYYKIHLPIHTTNTVFEFIHSDYDTQRVEVNADEQKVLYLSLFKHEEQSVIQSNSTGSSDPDSSVYEMMRDKFLYDPSNSSLTIIPEEYLQKNKADKTDLYAIGDHPEVLFTLDGVVTDPHAIHKDSIAYIRYEQGKPNDKHKVLIRAFSKGAKQSRKYDNESALYIIDGIPQKNRTDLSDIQPEDIVSITTMKVKGNRADQFEGLPIEGKDLVIYVTTKDALLLEEIIEETDSVDLSNFRLLDPAEQPPILVIDGIIYSEKDFPSNLAPKDIKSIETIKSLEAQKRYGKEALGGAILITTKHPPTFKTIEGRIVEIETKKGIGEVKIKADNGSVAKTNENGYYQIRLPTATQKTFFEFDHPKYPKGRIEVKIVGEELEDIGFIKPENYRKDTSHLYEKTNLENALFIIDGQIREDIQSFDDVEALNLDIKYTETFKESKRRRLPLEYHSKGYNKVVRVVTENYQLPSVDRTAQGKLIDIRTGEPLSGAEINWVQDGERTLLTKTDGQGEYKITLPKGAKVIEYSYPGYTPKVITDRHMIELFPMHWTLHLRKKELPDKVPTFNKQLIISPNPGDDEISVEFNLEEAIPVEFELLDKEGNVLHSVSHHYSEAGKKEVTIPTTRFPANAYLLRVSIDDFSITRRIILK
ncbi:MAG: M56 family metallopeptidase [Bacteroidota bacterium]